MHGSDAAAIPGQGGHTTSAFATGSTDGITIGWGDAREEVLRTT